MRLGIPIKDHKISPSNTATKFVIVTLQDGKITKTEEYTTKNDLLTKVDFFITPHPEDVLDFVNMGTKPLITPHEDMDIGAIVNAFLFKELYSYDGL
ncbi:MAG: hypothetical protein GXO40_04725 [Epsilonproteobacteria bacterium]|nr:hypothetical protein [Campylobacterota bacterium]